MKCIFTGGGTLGHTNPAIAVAEAIRKLDSNADILFIMRERGAENASVIERGFKIEEIPAYGLQRTGGVLNNAQATIRAIIGTIKCISFIKHFRPDFIFGTGGYVSFAPLIAGAICGIPTYVHESNSTPGLVTRIAVKMGVFPFINFESTKRLLQTKKECIIVGMPLLPEFRNITKAEARKKLGIKEDKIYVISFGGSGGSDVMNETIMSYMTKLGKEKEKIIHLHATGEKYYSKAKEKYPMLCSGIQGQKIVPRIENMALNMNAADIVISRCGSSTLSEISATKKASILIPSPNVTDNHQYKNGKYLSDRNAAIMIEEKDLTDSVLGQQITALAESKELRSKLERNLSGLGNEDAAQLIANIILNGK